MHWKIFQKYSGYIYSESVTLMRGPRWCKMRPWKVSRYFWWQKCIHLQVRKLAPGGRISHISVLLLSYCFHWQRKVFLLQESEIYSIVWGLNRAYCVFCTLLSAVGEKKDKRYIYYLQINYKLLGETWLTLMKLLIMKPGWIELLG